MILRQTIIRHSRTAISNSSKRVRLQRCYASDVNIDDSRHRQSERDHKPIRSIPGHPDDESSLLDAIDFIPHTVDTAPLAHSLDVSESNLDSLSSSIKSYLSAQNGGAIPQNKTPFEYRAQSNLPPPSFQSQKELTEANKAAKQLTGAGSRIKDVYLPWSIISNPTKAEDITLPMLLANQCHLGHATALWHPGNSGYIFGIRHGIHIIGLETTLSYLRRAAKVVREVARRGGIILFIGTRKNTQFREVVVNSAKLAGAYHIFERWIPGSLTNGQQILESAAIKVVNGLDQELGGFTNAIREAKRSHEVLRPDLVVCLNPLENEVCLHECGLYGVPTIAIVDTDVNPSWVTYPIPANDDSPRSVALIAGALARAGQEGQALRAAEAEKGRLTYSTAKTTAFLKRLEQISALGDVQESRREGKADKDVD